MTRLVRFIGLGVLVALLCPVTLQAQFPSELVGFNGPPIDDPGTSQEMFQQPQFSGTTNEYIVANVDPYDNNGAFRASGLQTEGAAALEAYFRWVDTSDPYGWVRLTTYNGPDRPNPCLDTRGKVRFKITNRSELFDGEIGICLGIRETGAEGVAQMDDGGTTGPIEWVGVTGVMTDPNDPNVVTGPISAITLLPSPTAYELEWSLATGEVWLDGEHYDGGIFGFTGNGTLADCPNNRGTLEHIAITNVTSDVAVFIDFAIDELQFEATVPDPTPPPTILGPVVETDTTVDVQCVADATVAELFINDASAGTAVPGMNDIATFTGLTLEIGNVLTATQTANGITSALSTPVVVYAEGTALAENFDSYASQEELEMLWTQDDPTNDRKIQLTTGSASSCQNYVYSDYDPGPAVSRLYFQLPPINGTDTEPLLVTYRFKHDSNDTEARMRFELASSLEREYGAVGFAFTNGVGGQWGEQYTTMTNNPVPVEGYEYDYFYYDYALTGMERVPGVWHKMQIEVRSSVFNFYIDDELVNPVDPNTGLPLWPDGVPRGDYADDFRYVIIGVGFSNNGPAMMYDDISITVGDTEPPFGDPNPTEAPTVNGPLFPGGTLVELSDIDPVGATEVAVYVQGTEVTSATGPFPGGTAALTVPALYDGETVTATQTVAAVESCFSWPVVVGVPAPTVEPILVMGEVSVDVSDIEENLATDVRVYEDREGDLVELGNVSNPTEDPVEVSVAALEAGMRIVATQTIGGVESPISEAVMVEAEPPAIVEWIQTSQMLYGLTDHQLVHLNGYIYSIGGRTGSGSTNPMTQANEFVFYAPVNLDGSLGDWQETTSMPITLAAHGAAAYGDRVYVWGGWAQGWPTMNTCLYADQNPDGTLGAWTMSAVTIPDNEDVSPPGTQMDAFGRGTMIFDGRLYLINGEWDNGSTFGNTNSCYYNPITPEGDFGAWVMTTPTNTLNGSWFHGVAAIEGTTENYMYRVAGNYRGTTEYDMYRSVIAPDGSLGPWVEDEQHVPEARYEHACAVAGNKWLFVICGLSGAEPQNTVYYTAIDPDTGALDGWRVGPEYPETVSRNCAVTYTVCHREFILVTGGGPYSGPDGNRTPRCYYAELTGAPVMGDVDGDGDVDLSDLAALLGAYGTHEGDPSYNPDADLACDGDVDLSAWAALLGNYGYGG